MNAPILTLRVPQLEDDVSKNESKQLADLLAEYKKLGGSNEAALKIISAANRPEAIEQLKVKVKQQKANNKKAAKKKPLQVATNVETNEHATPEKVTVRVLPPCVPSLSPICVAFCTE